MEGAVSVSPQAAPKQARERAGSDMDTPHSLADTVFSFAADVGARVASAIDFGISLPKQGCEALAALQVPILSAIAPAVGAVVSGVAGILVHGQTLGAFKWLQTLRLWNGVESGVRDSLQGTEGVDSLTVQSFLATVPDKELRDDLKEYFLTQQRLHTAQQNSDTPSAPTTEIKKDLAALELKIGRRAELNELQTLAQAVNDAQQASQLQIERLANTMASTMIERVKESYTERLGTFGSTMEGDWVKVAARGESGREELQRMIRDRLVSAYQAEDRGEKAQQSGLQDVKAALHEAFLTKSASREATFYSVWGVLLNTGAIAGLVGLMGSSWEAAAAKIKAFGEMFLPDWIQHAAQEGMNYAWGALYTVWGYLGVKAGVAGADLVKHVTPSKASVDAGAVRADAGSSGSSSAHIDQARVDAAAMAASKPATGIDAAKAVEVVHGADAANVKPHPVHIDASTRVDVGGVKVDPAMSKPQIHLK